MKHVFIINPSSGKKEQKEDLLEELKSHEGKLDFEVYTTKGVKDATRYVDEYCNNYKDDVTFYACGGDGTINEIVSGMIGHDNAVLACYPCGSGNDFVKVYGGKEKFLKLDNLLNGKETKIDVMKVNDMYAVNVTNFGFDATVCDVANKVRRKKIIGGKRSYTTGIIVAILKARRNKCKVVADDVVLSENKILLSTVANGKYVGGAYYCAPKSINDDGLLEVCVVKPISLFKFISIIGPYKKGQHLDNPKYQKFIKYCQAKKVVIDAPEGFKICLDGEIYTGTHFEIENMKQAIRFVVPREENEKDKTN